MLFLFSLKSGQTLFTHSVLYLTVDQTVVYSWERKGSLVNSQIQHTVSE